MATICCKAPDGSYVTIEVEGSTVTVTWNHPTDAAPRSTSYETRGQACAENLAEIIASQLPDEYLRVEG